RLNKNIIGFGKESEEQLEEEHILSQVNALDLKTFGLIPELLGRFPVVTNLEPLDDGAMLKILTQPKNAIIKQYQALFALDGITLSVADEVLEEIVNKTKSLGLGARGLRSISENLFSHISYNIDDYKGNLNIDMENFVDLMKYKKYINKI
ncbi:MAG: ATP-dependent Clp protease ATP-binding subunit ClpX, partial [Flavobacteriaceae bacterium]|nr:ATP-dependent Clp protease ATP-binding subunit ClpX [Flavobacteriaceae bacterium]